MTTHLLMRRHLLHVAGSLALTFSLASPLQAQVVPEILYRFGQSDGDSARIPFAPPVWLAATQDQPARLVGTTTAGGDRFQVLLRGAVTQLDSGVGYTLSAQDGSSYRMTSLGGVGGYPISTHLATPNGKVFAASTYASTDPARDDAERGGALFYLEGAQAVSAGMSAQAAQYYQGRGQLAVDDAGNVYFGAAYPGLVTTTGIQRALMRRNVDGTIDKIVDFNDFTETYLDASNREQTQLTHGGDPTVLYWSKQDQALYIASSIAGQPHFLSKPDPEKQDAVKGFLVRINAQALTQGVTRDDVQVLHRFYPTLHGIPLADDTHVSGLVEDGDWLYGSTNKAPGGAVWRIRKDDPSSFSIVHGFEADLSEAGEFSDRGGLNPQGPMVRAADGNIYGTTLNNANVIVVSGRTLRASGVGSVYRIRIGSTADRQDDQVETLHYFSNNEATGGTYPVGLSVGSVEGGRQFLYGATKRGGLAQNNGVVYRFAIDLPPVRLTSFTANDAASVTVDAGARVLLAWATEGASVCEPTGEWAGSGAKAASGSEQIAALAQRDEAYVFGLRCRSDAGVESEETQVRVTVQAPAPQPTPTPTPTPQPEEQATSSGGGGGAFGALVLLLMAGAVSRRRR